jgi:methionyl-tRNA synthetase
MIPRIPFEEFAKIDLRIGKILKVEDHPDADKLYVLTVDLAEDSPRTLVAGLKHFCSKKQLIGKRAIFVANLEKANIRGIESDGMILAAVNHDETQVCILSPNIEDMEIGSKVE